MCQSVFFFIVAAFIVRDSIEFINDSEYTSTTKMRYQIPYLGRYGFDSQIDKIYTKTTNWVSIGHTNSYLMQSQNSILGKYFSIGLLNKQLV